MAFVEIYRGERTLRVPKAVYDSYYKNLGYHINARSQKVSRNKDVEDVEENKDIDLESIPISSMKPEQLKEYAERHNIDTSSATCVKEARKIIQQAVRESRM